MTRPEKLTRRGPDHQVTIAETAPAKTAAASSGHPARTASQCRLVMLCVQANWFVAVSNSLATVGAPQSNPGSTGTSGGIDHRGERLI